MSEAFPPVQPQDPIQELLPDLFLVRGSITFGPGRISRNMVVIRNEGELSLIGAVRMSPEAEVQLESLGKVAHVIRLCSAHGLDDAYTVQRFQAKFWAARDTASVYPEPAPDVVFDERDELPVGPCSVMRFKGILDSEVALVWHRSDGVIVTADALQHYDDWRGFSFAGWLFLRLCGFKSGTIVGPVWRRLFSYDDELLKASIDRLLEADFQHAVALHGTFVSIQTRERITQAIERELRKPLLRDWAYKMMIKQFGPELEARREEMKTRGPI